MTLISFKEIGMRIAAGRQALSTNIRIWSKKLEWSVLIMVSLYALLNLWFRVNELALQTVWRRPVLI